MISPQFSEEYGSIPLALLVSIVTAGLIVALFATVQSSQRSVSRDRDVSQSIQVADAGVQEAFIRLVNEGTETGDALHVEIGELIPTVENPQFIPGEADYTWQARRTGRRLWEGRSVGTFRSHSSVVEFEVGLLPMFEHALWGDSEAGIQAGNATIASLSDSVPELGSNGPVTLHNSIAALIPAGLLVSCHNDDPMVAAANCAGIGGAETPPWSVEYPDLGSLAFAPRAEGADVGGECWEAGQPVNDGPFTDDYELVGGNTYCFSQVTWPRGSEFVITPNAANGRTDVVIYVSPTPSVGDDLASVLVGSTGAADASTVNWLPAGTTDPNLLTSSAGDLVIIVGGTRPVEFRNNSSKVVMGIYAPRARCEIRAQVTVVGAMICGEIPTTGPGSASGGWKFYYDDSLAELEVDDVYRIRQWSQETCSQSSYDLPGAQCPGS